MKARRRSSRRRYLRLRRGLPAAPAGRGGHGAESGSTADRQSRFAEAAGVLARVPQLAGASQGDGRRRHAAGAGDRRPRDDRAALHAVHHRSRPAGRDADAGRSGSHAFTPPARHFSSSSSCRTCCRRSKDYRQRLLNVRVMLSLRRSLFERLVHLPLPRLWDMKTGGILSRLTRRRRHHDRPDADGDRVADDLRRPAGDRAGDPHLAELAPGADGHRDHPGRDGR